MTLKSLALFHNSHTIHFQKAFLFTNGNLRGRHISERRMSSGFSHIVACVGTSFLLRLNHILCMCHILFICWWTLIVLNIWKLRIMLLWIQICRNIFRILDFTFRGSIPKSWFLLKAHASRSWLLFGKWLNSRNLSQPKDRSLDGYIMWWCYWQG